MEPRMKLANAAVLMNESASFRELEPHGRPPYQMTAVSGEIDGFVGNSSPNMTSSADDFDPV